jgi:tetratricopeptide (TPR) repeat protein
MNDVPQAKLYDLLSRQGAELLREPGRLRLLLLEGCPNFPEEVDVLVRALEYGLVALLVSEEEAKRETFLRRFREEIENSRELALWAMDAWEKAREFLSPLRSSPKTEETMPSWANAFGYTVARETDGQVVPVSFLEEKPIPAELASLLGAPSAPPPPEGAAEAPSLPQALVAFFESPVPPRTEQEQSMVQSKPFVAARPEVSSSSVSGETGTDPTLFAFLGGRPDEAAKLTEETLEKPVLSEGPTALFREPRLGESAITTSEKIPEPAVSFLGEKPLEAEAHIEEPVLWGESSDAGDASLIASSEAGETVSKPEESLPSRLETEESSSPEAKTSEEGRSPTGKWLLVGASFLAVGVLLFGVWSYLQRPARLIASGERLFRQGDYSRALEYLQKGLSGNGGSGGDYFLLGETLRALGRFDEAVTAYRTSERLDSGDALVYSGLGDAYLRLGAYEEAVDAFEKALARVALLPDAQKGLGAALLRLGRNDEAKRVLEKVLGTDREDSSVLDMLAEIYRRAGEPGKAIALYERALALTPGDARLLSALDEAKKEEERLLSLERKRRAAEEAKALWEEGKSLQDQGKHEEAVVAFRRALALDAEHLPSLKGLGDAYAALGRIDEAVRVYEELLAFSPDDLEAKAALERCLASKSASEDEQRKELALREKLGRADALAAAGENLQAATLYGEVAEERSDPLLFVRQGEVFAAAGKAEEALRAYEQALKFAPEDREVARRVEAARQALEKAERKRQLEQLLRKAGDEERQGRFRDAVKTYRAALALSRDAGKDVGIEHGKMLTGLGRVLAASGLLQEAEHVLAEAVRTASGKDAEAKRLLSDVRSRLEAQRKRREAAALAEKGKQLVASGRTYEGAVQLREAVLLVPDEPDFRFHFAEALSDLGMYREAVREYAYVLRKSPERADALNSLAWSYAKLGQYDEALQAILSARKKAPENVILLENEGYLRFRKGEFDQALRAFESALRQPDVARPRGYREMGPLWESNESFLEENGMRTQGGFPLPQGTLFWLPSPAEAENSSVGTAGLWRLSLPRENLPRESFSEIFQRALLLDPQMRALYGNVAVTSSYVGRGKASPGNGVAPVVEIAREDALSRVFLGHALLRKGMVDSAMEQLEEALKIDPFNSTASTLLGYAALRKGQKALALEAYKNALLFDPDNDQAKRVLAELSR